MAMDLVLSLTALVEERELKESPHVGTLACEGNEHGHVGGIVFGVLPVGIEVDRPLETTHGKGLAGNVLADAHPLGEGITLDHELVRPVHGLRH